MKITGIVILSLLIVSIVCFYLFKDRVYISAMEQTQVHVESADFSFGSIEQNKPRQAYFNLKNTGSSPLFIQNVETSCGCTLPEWTKHPIKPGKSGEVKITYDAEYPGRFHKTITVYANVENPIRLTISGEVEIEE